jgi:hypothetical protein
LELVKVHLELIKGNKNAIKTYLDALKPDTIIDEGILLYIEYLKYFSGDTAVPTARFATMLMKPQPQYHDLWTVAVMDVTRRCYHDKSPDAKAVISNLPAFAVEEPLNALFNGFGYNEKSDPKAYIGHFEFDGYFTVDNEDQKGWLALDVDKDGKLSGTITFKDLKEILAISGSLDGFGRGVLTVKIGAKNTSAAFALVPFNIYQAQEKVYLPQMILTMDTLTPFRIAFVVTAVKKAGNNWVPEFRRNMPVGRQEKAPVSRGFVLQ